MEAHNGLSARIVEEAGFKGIWASGLAMSAQFGVRDANELSWTQVVDVLELMADVTTIPILLDGDTGYGNFNSMRRLVRKLEQRGIAGVCIEDKVFPKTNSFIAGERQPLCDVEEFCGKLKAGKDSQHDSDFCIIARTEALITGWGLDEALRRAEAYREAGADAILVHSKRSRPDEILAFAERWDRRLPLVIVPTKYYSTPTQVFRQAGINMVIWANHLIRAAAAAMQAAAREVQATETLINIEDRITPVNEIFRLQGADELVHAERYYLSSKQSTARVVILAASRGQGLEPVTTDRPKVMLSVGGIPLLTRLVEAFRQQHIHHITVVAGYKPDAIDIDGIQIVQNAGYNRSGELASLACAREMIAEDTIITYGDLLLRRYILRDFLDCTEEIAVVVDSALPPVHSRDFRDLAYCSRPDDHSLFQQDVDLVRITENAKEGRPSGRWIGMLRVRRKGCEALLAALDRLQERSDFDSLGIPDLLNELIAAGNTVKVLYIHGHWLDVNNLEDLGRASDFTHGKHW